MAYRYSSTRLLLFQSEKRGQSTANEPLSQSLLEIFYLHVWPARIAEERDQQRMLDRLWELSHQFQ